MTKPADMIGVCKKYLCREDSSGSEKEPGEVILSTRIIKSEIKDQFLIAER